MGNRNAMTRLLASCRPRDFADPNVARLFGAMSKGRESVVEALATHRVFTQPGCKVMDAVIEAMIYQARKARQVDMAGKLGMAARLMSPEQFLAFIAKSVAEMTETPVADKLSDTSEILS